LGGSIATAQHWCVQELPRFFVRGKQRFHFLAQRHITHARLFQGKRHAGWPKYSRAAWKSSFTCCQRSGVIKERMKDERSVYFNHPLPFILHLSSFDNSRRSQARATLHSRSTVE
jgi:hypothetical protein